MNSKEIRMPASLSSIGKVLGYIVPVFVAIWFFAFLVCYFGVFYSNPVTPAGYAGYVTRGALAGKTEFVKVQYGPTSTSAGWLLHVTNVPLTPRTYQEDFSGPEGIVSGDNTRIAFAINVTVRIRPNQPGTSQDWVRNFVENYTTLHDGESPDQVLADTYTNNLKQPIRGFVRLAAESIKGMDIQDNMPRIADEVNAKVQALTANTPFEVTNITIGYIHYPDSVTSQVANNLIASQQVLEQNIQTQLTTLDAQIMVTDNEGLAEAAAIINKGITPQWLQYEALQAELANVKSESATNLFIPVGPMGVPTVSVSPTANAPSADAAPSGVAKN